VTDFGWDYLPRLGYAVRDAAAGIYVLHEEKSGRLHPINLERATELGLVDRTGRMIRHGQPRITACQSVRQYIAGYAESDCVLDNGRDERLLIAISGDALPPETWLVGKRPMDVKRYP
jgi:hypothetical protein